MLVCLQAGLRCRQDTVGDKLRLHFGGVQLTPRQPPILLVDVTCGCPGCWRIDKELQIHLGLAVLIAAQELRLITVVVCYLRISPMMFGSIGPPRVQRIPSLEPTLPGTRRG